MKFSTSVTAGALLVGQAIAHPVAVEKRQSPDIDAVIFQFALTVRPYRLP